MQEAKSRLLRRGFVRHLEIQKKGIRVMGPYSGDVFLLDGFIVYEGGVVVKRGILAFLLFLCLLAGEMNIEAADSLPYQKTGSRKEVFAGKGWQTYKGKKYYIAANGKKVTGWRKIGNYKYYFAMRLRSVGWRPMGASTVPLSWRRFPVTTHW